MNWKFGILDKLDEFTFPANTIDDPVTVHEGVRPGSHHHDILHISPCQTGTVISIVIVKYQSL